ncbi:ankyrin 3 [Fusarium mundagurra]|uniref:Ankyrin 3 n=1 Tax=Fusarium mundagurra TaxID=1567541 RepID=A0A8H6D859_9HYPO|nr:ankyrin 3 [Fusarium mundagurra]
MNFPHRSDIDPDGSKPPNVTQRADLGSQSHSQYAAAGPSIQKRHPDEFGQRSKKQRRDKPHEEGAGMDNTGGDSDGDDRGSSQFDGLRYPHHNNPSRGLFACPFHKYDPVRYTKCLNIRLASISYVMQHIRKRHVLNLKPKDIDYGPLPPNPKDISVYCPQCRHEFHGLGADIRLQHHGRFCENSSQPATIENTGVLLPHEFDRLKLEMRSVSGDIAKWDVMWQIFFPFSPTSSPYVDIVVSRQQAQEILQTLLRSSAVHPLSSSETRQSAIDGAVSAIYDGSPVTKIEPEVNDNPTTNLADNISNVYHFGESKFNEAHGISPLLTVPESDESFRDQHDMDQWCSPLEAAIFDLDHDKVHTILKNSFNEVAVGQYSWLLELRALGLSVDEIANELMEISQHGPWIYSEVNVLDIGTYHPSFHIPKCLHSEKDDEAMPTVSSEPSQALMNAEADLENSVRETIEYLCGIGGVSPMPDGSKHLQFGSVVFEDSDSTAIVSSANSQSVQVAPDVLRHLQKAIGTLQQVGGCCDSFTFLARQESVVELTRVKHESGSILELLMSRTSPEASIEGLNPQLVDSLTAQFLPLAFALYAQGHCEPLRPFFLDTPLKRILLIGNQIWGRSSIGPCILASPVELSCFGEMVQRRVFAFQYFEAFERSKIFSESYIRFDLMAYPEDLLDTWGPGDFIIPNNDSESLHAISIGGGLITSASTETENHQLPVLHWSPVSEDNIKVTSTFPRHGKMVIGSRVSINQACRMTPQDQIRKSISWLEELGTFPSYWEVSERQLGLGLQAGQSAVGILNFAQTWVKRLGQTKKSNILAKRSLSIADLEGPLAVQVSFCTGIARRVQLRELLADVLPIYVAELATQPCYWKRLQDCNICSILRDNDFRKRYQQLDRELQAEFETLAIAVLFQLQDTGVDRKGENFVVGCFLPELTIQCFKIPIEKESFWARILADSEDVATFAYVATRCFETDLVRCRGLNEQWMNTTSLFSTAVSLCQDRNVTQGMIAQQTNWTLKDSEAYLIGRVDAPLLVRVIRPNIQDEPELLVSMSTIIAPFLRRWSRKQGYKRPWRLRESRAIDHQHQMAESVVVAADFETS